MRKTLSYMGFAKKAGQLISGTDTCRIHMQKGRVKLLIVAEDTGPAAREKILGLSARYGVPVIEYGSMEELSRAVGTSGRTVFGITEEGFASTIREAIETENRGEVSNEEVSG